MRRSIPRAGAGITIMAALLGIVACATGPGPGAFSAGPGPEVRMRAEEDAEEAQRRLLEVMRSSVPASAITPLLAESASLVSSELGVVTGRDSVAAALIALLAEHGPEGRIERHRAATCLDESVLEGRLVGETSDRQISVRLRTDADYEWRVEEIRLLPRHITVAEIDERCDRYRAREAFSRSPTAVSLTIDPLFLYETATADQGALSVRGKGTRIEARLARRILGPFWTEIAAARQVAPGYHPSAEAAELDRREEAIAVMGSFGFGLFRLGIGPVVSNRVWEMTHPGLSGEGYVRWRTTGVGVAGEVGSAFPLVGGWFVECRASVRMFGRTTIEPFAHLPAEEVDVKQAGIQLGAGFRF